MLTTCLPPRSLTRSRLKPLFHGRLDMAARHLYQQRQRLPQPDAVRARRLRTGHGPLRSAEHADLLVQPVRTAPSLLASPLADSFYSPSRRRFELIPQWFNYLESNTGFDNIAGSAYAMKMFEDDGTGTAGQPKSIMYLVNRPPTMLPTVQLHEQVLNSVGAYNKKKRALPL